MANRVKTVFKRADDYKKMFKHSQCLLLISVGQESHEGERFESTINLINDSFSSCIISLYDTLQRHTMALNSIYEPNDYYETSLKEGDLWIARNRQYLNNLTIPNKIIRWDMWLNHVNFQSQRNNLLTTINSDATYKNVFDNTVSSYLARYEKRLNETSNFNLSRAKNICFEYLLEECTILCLWPELQCQFEIYPNRHNDAIEETRSRFITSQYPNLLVAIATGFRNAKQIKPQYFQLLKNKEDVPETSY
jgi:hypothetical protein